MRQIFAVKSHYQKIKTFYFHYERWLLPATLLAGFVVDYLTFKVVQINIVLTVLFVYLILVGVAMIFIHFYDEGRISHIFRYVRLFVPLLIEYTFGALLGGSLIFYWFSGSISVSWPFIIIIAILMISNDVFRRRFLEPIVQISVYFFITFSFLSLALPFLFNSLSPKLFLLAGGVSLVFIYLYVQFLAKIRDYIKLQKKSLLAMILTVFFVMNLLYFSNIIPPIPLSLREAHAYHSINRSGGSYVLRGEAEAFWDKFMPGQTLHLAQGERAYVYTSIFAPTALNTTILHHWQYYDEKKKDWVSRDKLSFDITGGRKEGFRGYSSKSTLTPGNWRVYVETQRGQVLGRIKFTVKRVEKSVELIEVVR